MPERPRWMVPADEEILRDLRDHRTSYVALIAGRRGLAHRRAEERCEALADRGLLERVSEEVVYRLTEEGHRTIEETRDSPGVAPTPTGAR